MSESVVESMRQLGQLQHVLTRLFGKEPLVTITMSEYERLKSAIPSIPDIQATTLANLAIIRENHMHDAEMIRLRKRIEELQEENGRLRQEIESLKKRKKWRILRCQKIK